MKKRKLISLLLTGALGLSLLAGCTPGTPKETGSPAPAGAYKAGTYSATADGNNGPVKVEVTVSDSAITDVKVVEQAETASIAGPALERIPAAIKDNQSLGIDAVTGATVTSTAILTAVADCVTQAGGDAEALKKVPVKKNEGEAVGDMTADVVIIGAGGAGLSAAVEAKDAGAGTVVLLEKMAAIGGTTFTSQGVIGGYGTNIAKKLNVEVSYEDMYANLMSNASYRLDPALTAITVGKSGETIDWLQDRVGMPFADEIRVGYGPLQMMHVIEGAGEGMNTAFSKAIADAGVNLMLETEATEILMNADGSVAGVKAVKGGQEMTISAKSVVVATGGYAYNPELTALLTPELAGTYGIGFPGSTGEGIIMASNVGAALSHTDDMMCVLKDYEIMSEHNGNSATANNFGFMALPNMILVGAAGTRFVNEKDQGYMTQALNSPIFDQMHKDNLGYVWAISDQAAVDASGRTKRGMDLPFITANTPAELAALMGVDAAGLEKTINDFNSYVDAGYDKEFRRTGEELSKLTAPYVAVAQVPCEIITYGGIARNEKAEVIRADGTSIPGLFTAGEASANSAYMGFTLSNCFTWGRIAGAGAANYAK